LSSNIVTCEFLGRLGNNLFQVAAMIGYAKNYGAQWGIPPGYHHRQIYNYFRHLPIYKGNVRKLHTYDTATDEGFVYKQIPHFPNGVKLRGFWQSYKYFEHAKEEVLKAWNFKVLPEYKDFTSLHVRRTDYLTHSDSFGAISHDYIRQAIDHSKAKKILCFSDDLFWCKQTLPKNFPDVEWHFENDSNNEYTSLCQMSSCGNNIIANSSYSYVAAYANRNTDKIVVTPHYASWFGPKAKLDTKDLLPPEWHQIKFR
jgi:hypothetical protein